MGEIPGDSERLELPDGLHHALDILWRDLKNALSECMRGYHLCDPAAALEHARMFATRFYDCHYEFYSQYSANRSRSQTASENFALCRVVGAIKHFPSAQALLNRDQSLLSELERSISEHADGVKQTASVSRSRARKQLWHVYSTQFPDVKKLDVCWAAKQYYREWKRWVNGESPDGHTPDRSFRSILTSGLHASVFRPQLRPRGWH